MRSSGEPGLDQATFYVRGVGTFGYDARPMVIIDGVETTSDAMVNMIAPEAIESFSVLKDATATALYGSRGANGVILINTKEGRNAEKMSINVTYDTSVATPTYLQ
jgi:TonB-dependent SusC/RagA subfamily outer membrane receptor